MKLRQNYFVACTVSICLSLFTTTHGVLADVHDKIKISEIFYFGYQGLDLPKIKEALPLHIGDEFENYLQYHAACQKVKAAVKDLTGKRSTDEALIFYDKRNVVYIGLPGESNRAIELLPVPTKKLNVAEAIHKLYDETMQANDRQLRSGEQKDKDTYADLREKTKTEALQDPKNLLAVLKSSDDARERLVAAHALGLIAADREQLGALVDASADPDHVVRNNAIRALGVILADHPDYAPLIPCSLFVDLINSPEWTDRNKGVFVLLGLTRDRNPKVLAEMRERSLASLIEMCQWPVGYSDAALILLGRMGNIPDQKLQSLIAAHDDAAIIKAAEKGAM